MAVVEGNRDKLLHAARECLSERGYAHTTARDLVEASGANLASIGYHFGGKEALLNQAVAENTRAWMRAIEEDLRAQEPATVAELLEHLLSITVDRFSEIEPYLRSFVEAFPPAVRFDVLRAEMAAAYDDVRDAGQALIETVLPGPAPAVNGDSRALASILIALCDGLILQWLLDPDATPNAEGVAAGLRALASQLDEPGPVSA